MIVPVILAGGTGTRLWPLSRARHPKQMLSLVDDHTMLQSTVLRLQNLKDCGGPILICNQDHRFMAAEQLLAVNAVPDSIILEPVGRNTAPAVAVSAFKAIAADKDAILLILPADHYIKKIQVFHEALKIGGFLAEKGKLITFGIVPTAPETGYGYIRKGESVPNPKQEDGNEAVAFAIDAFVEKPDLATAREYIETGAYCWNSGMFMFRASAVLDELKKYAPEIVDACRNAFQKGQADLDFFRLDEPSFKACPGESIDYAVMEKTENGLMIPLDAGWDDLGSWEALWQTGTKDDKNNVIHGDVLIDDVTGSYLNATDRLVAAVGLKDHIVVETSDAVLISPREKVQDVKQLVEKLKSSKRDEAIVHRNVYRPWGFSEGIYFSDRFQVKKITVNPGAKISLQKHERRAEHWIVLRGIARITKEEKQFDLKENESAFISAGMVHRLENPGDEPIELIEVRSGEYLGEDDIVRLDDVYGR